MDLASQALDVTPWRPEAYEQARTALRAAMAESGPRPEAAPVPAVAPMRGRGFSRADYRRRRTLGTRGKVGIGAGIAAVTAAALVLVTTSTPQPAATAGSASRAPAATSPLMSLAAHISAISGTVPGNASLVIDKPVYGGKLAPVVYSLYTDSGALYTGDDKQTLMRAVDQNDNQVESVNTHEIAAARYAASGDLATARKMMVNSFPNDYFLSYAARKQIWEKNLPALRALLREKGSNLIPTMPTGQVLQDRINNSVWNGCQDALLWAGNDPHARAGVMRLLSTVPDLTVVNSTTDGQPTLTITAGPARFEGFRQVLTISAATGLPISSVSSGAGLPTGGETDQDSRVTVADIKAGKF